MNDLLLEVQKVYLDDNRPWILGFSGGKDSTCMIQIIWNALSLLPNNKLRTKTFSSYHPDTLFHGVILFFISVVCVDNSKRLR